MALVPATSAKGFDGGTVTGITNFIGNAGSGALVYIEADDVGQPFALEVGGGTSGDVLVVVADNVTGPGLSAVRARLAFIIEQATAAPIDSMLNQGDLALWFDSSAGAPKLMVKGKIAGNAIKTAAIPLA